MSRKQTPESAIAQLFHELRRQKPAVAYIPNVDAWWLSLPPIARATFIDLLDAGTDPHDPIVILATSETELDEMPKDLMANVFGWYGKGSRGIVKVDTPSPVSLLRFSLLRSTKTSPPVGPYHILCGSP